VQLDRTAQGEDVHAVDVEPILVALQQGAERLQTIFNPLDAPPAFLIDADRQTPRRPIAAGMFDNRSVVFTTDFPSAARLAAHGIKQAILVRDDRAGLGGDLRYALQLWQKAGVMLSAKWLSETGGPTPLTLPRPHWLAGLWWRLKALFQFRRNVAGEFGTFIPIAAAG
jgi:hypothetical protein